MDKEQKPVIPRTQRRFEQGKSTAKTRRNAPQYGCGRCQKPFVGPLATICSCPTLTPFDLQGQRV